MKTIDDVIKAAAASFLSWQLPDDFNPDGGLGLTKPVHRGCLTGTNLLTYHQAAGMFKHCVEEAIAELLKAQPKTVVPKGWKLLKDTTHEERSYPEEAKSENGAYSCVCLTCGRSFTGHKRRPVCRICAGTYAVAVEAPTPEDRAEAASAEDNKIYKAMSDRYFRDAGIQPYAGVTVWKGERSVTQLVSAEQLNHEMQRGSTMTTAAKTCLAWLNRD